MTKRFGNFPDNSTKKFKNNNNLDDLWGDDLDDKDINDVLLFATQVCEEKVSCTQQNNVSILPPYNAFKQTTQFKRAFTSTQSNPDLSTILQQPSTSKMTLTTNKNGPCNGIQENGFKRTKSFEIAEELTPLEIKIKKLQEDHLAKEGEISILRTQLKEVRKNNESDMHKKEKEWSGKLTTTTKQLNAVKSELEFKNLEIANLKQKVVEIAKLNNLDASFTATQSPYFKQPKPPERCFSSTSVTIPVDKKINSKIYFQILPIAGIYCPLQYTISSSIFTLSKEEKYLIDIKNKHMCRNTIPFLQNQMSQELIEKIIRLQPKVTLLDNNKQLSFDYIHYEISELMKCSLDELNNIATIPYINKILMVSEQLLCNLHQFLHELEQNTETEKSKGVDVTYLETNFKGLDLNNSVFSAKEWCEKEMGINVRQIIAVIAEIFPYSNYLKEYLLNEKTLIFNENEEILKYLPVIIPKLDKTYSNNCDYLQLIHSIVSIIRKLKKADNFPGLLSAITKLLDKINLCWTTDYKMESKNIAKDISCEILFSHPNIQVLINFTEALKSFPNCYRSKDFCTMPSKKVLKIDQKEKIVQYSKDTCFIQILCVFLEDSVRKVNDLRFYLNIVQSIINIMKQDEQWLYYQEDKYCDCLCKIVKLCVDVIYQTIKLFREECQSKLKHELVMYRRIFKSGLRVLHVLNIKAYDLIVKYIATYSQYKDIVTSLLEHKDILNLNESEVELLDDLYRNITEEIPMLEETSFDSISLWNQ